MDEEQKTQQIFILMVRLVQAQLLGAHYIQNEISTERLSPLIDVFSSSEGSPGKLSFEQVQKIHDSNPKETLVVVLQNQEDVNLFKEHFEGVKKIAIFLKPRWYPLVAFNKDIPSSLKLLQNRMNDDKSKKDYKFFLAVMFAVTRLANIPGDFRNAIMKKYGLKDENSRLVYRFEKFEIPDSEWNGIFDFISSEEALKINGSEGWVYLDIEEKNPSQLKALNTLKSIVTKEGESRKLFTDTVKNLSKDESLMKSFPNLPKKAESSTERSTKATPQSSTERSTKATPQSSTERSTKATPQSSTERSTKVTPQSSTERSTKVTPQSSTERSTKATPQSSTERSTKATPQSSTERSTKATPQSSSRAGEGPFRFQSDKSSGETEVEKLKEKWASEVVPLLVNKLVTFYEKNSANAAQVMQYLSIAAGIAASEKPSVYGGTVFNVHTRRLVKKDGKDGKKVIGEVKIGEEFGEAFEGKIISLAVDLTSEDPRIPWFDAGQVIPGDKSAPKINRTANNADLTDWIRSRILPDFWKKFTASIGAGEVSSKKGTLDEEKDLEKRIENAANARKESKISGPVKNMMGKTTPPGQEIGFAPRWSAILPILEGDEENILSNNSLDLKIQSSEVTREVLRLDKDDPKRLENITRNISEIFLQDTPSTIEEIRTKQHAVPVKVQEGSAEFILGEDNDEEDNLDTDIPTEEEEEEEEEE